jgi:hypothetical protein
MSEQGAGGGLEGSHAGFINLRFLRSSFQPHAGGGPLDRCFAPILSHPRALW